MVSGAALLFFVVIGSIALAVIVMTIATSWVRIRAVLAGEEVAARRVTIVAPSPRRRAAAATISPGAMEFRIAA